MLTKLDKLTLDFILAIILTDCLIGCFLWYELFYQAGDSPLETVVGIGAGIAIALAMTIVIFAHWELIRMISERFKRLRYERAQEEGAENERKRVKEILERSGVELTPGVMEKLFGFQNGPSNSRSRSSK